MLDSHQRINARYGLLEAFVELSLHGSVNAFPCSFKPYFNLLMYRFQYSLFENSLSGYENESIQSVWTDLYSTQYVANPDLFLIL